MAKNPRLAARDAQARRANAEAEASRAARMRAIVETEAAASPFEPIGIPPIEPEPEVVLEAAIEPEPEVAPEIVTVYEGDLASTAHRINQHLQLADRSDAKGTEHRLAAALTIAKAKEQCVAVGLNFTKWAAHHISDRYAPRTIQLLLKVGQAENPGDMLDEFRSRNAFANKAWRERKKLTMEVAKEVVARATPHKETTPDLPPPPPEEASAGLDDVGLFHSLPLMDEEQRRALADRAASGLPAHAAREHVEAIAHQIGMAVVRGPSGNYFVTVEGLLADFVLLPADQQQEFLRRAKALPRERDAA